MEKKTIQDWLKGYDAEFDTTSDKKIKIIRHADSRTSGRTTKPKELRIAGKPFPSNIPNLYVLYLRRKDLFTIYQSEQEKRYFSNVKYIVSFIGQEGNTARFVGVYKVLGRKQSPHSEDEWILELKPVEAFASLETKLIIEWCSKANSWHQYYYNLKPVVRVEEGLPANAEVPIFTDYLDVNLSYPELEALITHPDWIAKLQACHCIYAILDNSCGRLYVGSTYNYAGVYGRWNEYAKNGHGGDKDLEALIAKDPDYARNNFSWCILETLPLNISQTEATKRESIWKDKLGTRKHGYNNN